MNAQRHAANRPRPIAVVAAVLFAVAAAAATLDRVHGSAAPAVRIGAFTGEVTPDGPVYRLPPVNVVVEREVELARIARDERLDQARAPKAANARKPSA
jgi:hypothetical protein